MSESIGYFYFKNQRFWLIFLWPEQEEEREEEVLTLFKQPDLMRTQSLLGQQQGENPTHDPTTSHQAPPRDWEELRITTWHKIWIGTQIQTIGVA